MVTIEANMEDVPSWDPGGGKVEPGIYEVVVDSVEVGSAMSGSAKLTLKCKVVDGPATGSTVFADRSLHPNALGYLRGMFDMLNVYSTGNNFDEQKLIGRFMRVQVVAYTKQDGSEGTKVDKLFRSEINDGKNEQADITGGVASVPAKSNGGGKPAAAPARPPAARQTGNGARQPAAPHPAGNNGARPAAPPAGAAAVAPEDDLPF